MPLPQKSSREIPLPPTMMMPFCAPGFEAEDPGGRGCGLIAFHKLAERIAPGGCGGSGCGLIAEFHKLELNGVGFGGSG